LRASHSVSRRFGDLVFEPEKMSLSPFALTNSFLVAAAGPRAAPPLIIRRHDFGAAQTKFFRCLYLPRYQYGPVALLSPFGFNFIDLPPLIDIARSMPKFVGSLPGFSAQF
jgi:hypothetical protein